MIQIEAHNIGVLMQKCIYGLMVFDIKYQSIVIIAENISFFG
jgi:hypothetical protein